MTNEVRKLFSMKEVCEQTNLSYDTLKFYCNEGLVPNVKRNGQNHRVFSERDVAWVNSLQCLKNCGMSIKEIQEYIELCKLGKRSIPERQTMLRTKELELKSKITELEESIKFIQNKQKLYQGMLEGKVKYYSNLVDVEE